LLGALLLGLGSWRLVMGGSALASHLAWNPLIVGMLVLGLALALAGLPNALASARRGHGEFALGQALYASMASLLFLLGAVLLWQPMASVPSLMRFELPALFALAAATYPMMRSDGALSGREGGILLAAWLLFVAAELWLTFA
jgi:cation:H+ antiporter